jgi:hypothetical protein
MDSPKSEAAITSWVVAGRVPSCPSKEGRAGGTTQHSGSLSNRWVMSQFQIRV